MAGKRLKVFQAHMGFYDTVVAAPSQKAALQAWGAGAGEFAKGFAKVTTDPVAVENALAHPGRVLKRPFGSKGEYKIEADPVASPTSGARDRKSSAAAARARSKTDAVRRRAAERELHEAERAAARALEDLQGREAALAREKAAARETTRARIARAKARLAKSAPK